MKQKKKKKTISPLGKILEAVAILLAVRPPKELTLNTHTHLGRYVRGSR